MSFEHIPVLLNEVIEGLNIKPDGIYADGTLGGAGHSSEILKRLSGNGRLIGIDQDEEAIKAATDKIGRDDRVRIVRANYVKMPEVLQELGIDLVDGILLDIGVSSHQLDTPDRGFSYKSDAPLDMRMDQRQRITAADIVNEYEEKELFRVIRDYGEEKFAQNIAKHIVAARANKPIETTFELNEIIKASIPARMRQDGHPSKRTYQAIRIECNRELEVLKDSIDAMIDILKPGGRLAIITFHSLEDRIVKNAFRTAENPCTCPPNFPKCVCGKVSKGRIVGRKPVTATEEELEINSRSKSAKLRVFEKAIP
ncbi:MAG: 16S rRNA (cytosine(1402)-N(4))-methyltransferase RsmH [Lachnospiraceae bacterium]|nr:16S rRNA (cytosine(1402)-N(4))-methyltransferase RsmH [Lachnospiraceae bacterium]